MQHHHDARFSPQDLAQRPIGSPKQHLAPFWVGLQNRPQLLWQCKGNVPVCHVEHSTRELLRPFISIYLATRTAHPALSGKTHANRLPAIQADIRGETLRGVSTTQHFFHLCHLVCTDLPSIRLLVARPIIAIADNVLNRPVLYACISLAHSASLTRLFHTCKPNSKRNNSGSRIAETLGKAREIRRLS